MIVSNCFSRPWISSQKATRTLWDRNRRSSRPLQHEHANEHANLSVRCRIAFQDNFENFSGSELLRNQSIVSKLSQWISSWEKYSFKTINRQNKVQMVHILCRNIITNGPGFELRVKTIYKCSIEFKDCCKFVFQPKLLQIRNPNLRKAISMIWERFLCNPQFSSKYALPGNRKLYWLSPTNSHNSITVICQTATLLAISSWRCENLGNPGK